MYNNLFGGDAEPGLLPRTELDSGAETFATSPD